MEYFTTAGGITVHLQDSGPKENTAIVLLHGYLETMYIWSEFAEKLSEKYRVITLDMPGHGLTDSAPESLSPTGESINTMEFDASVIKALVEKIGLNKVCVGGHSMGGYVAQMCCKMYSETFEKLIIFNSNPYKDPEEKSADRKREIDVINGGKLNVLAAASIPKMYNCDNLRKYDDKVMETVELCETHNPAGIIASIKGMMVRPDMQDLWENPPVPIMLICGDMDNFLPLSTIEVLKEKFKKVKFALLPGTGHNSFIENSDEVLKEVINFIG